MVAINPTPATPDTLQQILAYQNYPSQRFPLEDNPDYEQVMVGPAPYRSGPTSQDPDRPVYLFLLFLNDALSAAGQKTLPNCDMLQFYLQLPFSVAPEQKQNVLHLMRLYNSFLPLGRFSLNADNSPVFRYRWHVYERDVDGLLLLEAVDTMIFFFEHLGYRIEQVATGQKTVAEIAKEEIDFSARPQAE